MPEQILPNVDFLCKSHHSFLVLKNTRQHLSPNFGAILKAKSRKKKKKVHNDVKNVPLCTLSKGHLFTARELKLEGRTLLVKLSWEHISLISLFFFFLLFSACANGCQVHEYWFGGLQIIFSELANLKIWTPHIMRINSLYNIAMHYRTFIFHTIIDWNAPLSSSILVFIKFGIINKISGNNCAYVYVYIWNYFL